MVLPTAYLRRPFTSLVIETVRRSGTDPDRVSQRYTP